MCVFGGRVVYYSPFVDAFRGNRFVVAPCGRVVVGVSWWACCTKRWFEFKNGTLSYYKKPNGESRGELELTVDTKIVVSSTKKNTFELVSGRAGLYAHAGA